MTLSPPGAFSHFACANHRQVNSASLEHPRRYVEELLSSHRPIDDYEARALERFRREIEPLENPFSESAQLTHVTASAIVVGSWGTILHRHRKLHRWLQPGGHIDEGEMPAEAAFRETTEETGLALAHPPQGPRLIHVDVHTAAADHLHLDLRYLLVAPSREPKPPPSESQDVAWFTFSEARTLADPSLYGALKLAEEVWKEEGKMSWIPK